MPTHVCKHKVCQLASDSDTYGHEYTRLFPVRHQLSFSTCKRVASHWPMRCAFLTSPDLLRSRRTANVRRTAIREGLRTDITPASLDLSIVSTHQKADRSGFDPRGDGETGDTRVPSSHPSSLFVLLISDSLIRAVHATIISIANAHVLIGTCFFVHSLSSNIWVFQTVTIRFVFRRARYEDRLK